MSMSSLSLGVSFDEIIAIFPGNLNNRNFKNETVTDQDQDEEEEEEINEKLGLKTPTAATAAFDPTEPIKVNNNDSKKKMKENLRLDLNKNPNGSASSLANSSDQAFISAMYNTIGIAILVVCIALCILLYIVLQAFLRPILWAILTSAFLFSFKRYMTDLTRNHLEAIEKSDNKTLAMELLLLPFKTFDFLIDYIWSFIRLKYRQLIVLVIVIVVLHLSSSFYQTLFYFCKLIVLYLQNVTYFIEYNFIIDYFSTWQFTFSLVIAYLIAVMFYFQEKYTTLFQIISLPVWMSLFLLGSKLMGAYRPLFMLAFIFLICMGSYSILFEFFQKHKSKFSLRKSPARKIVEQQENAINHCETIGPSNMMDDEFDDDEADNNTNDDTDDGLIKNNPNLSTSSSNSTTTTTTTTAQQQQNNSYLKSTLFNLYQTSVYYLNTSLNNSTTLLMKTSKRQQRKRVNSDKYFIGLFWLFLCVKLRYDFYIAIPFLVVVWKLLKHFVLFVWNSITDNSKFQYYWRLFRTALKKRKEALAPKPFLVLIKLFKKGKLTFKTDFKN
jgi:hypothetical protein